MTTEMAIADQRTLSGQRRGGCVEFAGEIVGRVAGGGALRRVAKAAEYLSERLSEIARPARINELDRKRERERGINTLHWLELFSQTYII